MPNEHSKGPSHHRTGPCLHLLALAGGRSTAIRAEIGKLAVETARDIRIASGDDIDILPVDGGAITLVEIANPFAVLPIRSIGPIGRGARQIKAGVVGA